MLATSVTSNEESFYRTSLETTPHSYFRLATGMEGIVPSYDSGMSSDSSPEMVVPYLEITVQPTDKFRFRYKSESGSHGKLRGPAKNRAKTNFPTVKLHNYDSKSKIEIKVSLYTNEENPKPHILQLVGKYCSGGTCTRTISEDDTVIFQYLEIESKKKDELLSILFQNKMDLLQEGEEYDEEEMRREALNESKTLNMNAARLCFEAFDNSIPICDKVFSNPVINLKAASSDLRITRLSLAAGRCSGGEDMILLCDKINKDDIKIRFYEKNENGEVVWEVFADFNKADVHHQVAIPFKTPALYENTEKIVYIELYRPSDNQSGEARLFTYIPDEIDAIRFSKKRKLAPVESVAPFQDVMQASSSSQFMSSPSDASTSKTDEDDPYLGPSASLSYDHIFNVNFPDSHQLPYNFDFLGNNVLVDPINCVDELLKAIQNEDIHIDSLTDDQTLTFEDSDNSTPLQTDSAIYPQSALPYDTVAHEVLGYHTSSHPTGLFGYLSQLGDVWSSLTSIAGAVSGGVLANTITASSSKVSSIAVSSVKETQNYVAVAQMALPSNINRRNSENYCPQSCLSFQSDLECRQKLQDSSKKRDTYKNFEDFKRSIGNLLINQKKSSFMRYITSLMSAEDDDGNLLLHLAVLEERENINLIAKMLEIAPHNVNKQNKSKQTSSHLATMKDSWNVLLLLMGHKGNPSIKNQYGNNCFHLAAKSNFVNSMKLLLLPSLKYGKPLPSLDDLNYEGLSALHLSIMNNAKECLLLLLKAGANVNLAEHKTGRSPLHLAMERHPTLVGPLLCHPLIDTDSTDFRGYTAHKAANCADNIGILKELLLIAYKSSKNERGAIFSYLRKEHAKPQKLAENIDENESSSCESSADTDCEDIHDGFTASSNHQDKIENTPILTFQNADCKPENLKTLDEEKLCKILDANGGWKKLGKFIGINETMLLNLEKLSQGASPARIILTKVKALYNDDEDTLKNVLQMAELEETTLLLGTLNI